MTLIIEIGLTVPEKKIFQFRLLPYIGMATILVMCLRPFIQYFNRPSSSGHDKDDHRRQSMPIL